ncbi:hypothetical protein M3Y99_00783600 [Aphelenchoides fujianensis]|nr:hypothetical protein M3Y99_00783600 [Aphelenchoides fujianensis]
MEMTFERLQRPKMSFDEAVELMESAPVELALESPDGLDVYALYQQSLLGDLFEEEPSAKYALLLERAQHKAWKQKRGLTREIAQRRYVALVQELLDFERVHQQVEEVLAPELTDGQHIELLGLRKQAVQGRRSQSEAARQPAMGHVPRAEGVGVVAAEERNDPTRGPCKEYIRRVREWAAQREIPIDLPAEKPQIPPETKRPPTFSPSLLPSEMPPEPEHPQ